MRAVDVESFAGGFTLGVSQAGFSLAGKRELPGGFGVPSVKANEHNLNRDSDWHIEDGPQESWTPLGGISLLFGNPPCSGFSGVSDKAFAGVDSKINECMWELVRYGARLGGSDGGWGPEVLIYESVQNAYSKGLTLLRGLHAYLRETTRQDYTLYHVLHNAAAIGGAAVRRRYFFVCARIPIGFAYDALDQVPLLMDSIGDLQGLENTIKPQPYTREATWWSDSRRNPSDHVDGHLWFQPQYHRQAQALLDAPDGWRQGENLTAALRRWMSERGGWPSMDGPADDKFIAHYGAEGRNLDFGGAWQPERWRAEKMARVVTGGSAQRSIHPFEPRPLSLREMYRLQGFPDSWLIEPAVAMANANTATLWPGKGIPVDCGRWIANQARVALEGTPRDDGRLRQTGEHEYVWDGTNDHRALYNEKSGERFALGDRPAKAIPVPRPATTKETTVTQERVQIGANDPAQIKHLLLTTGEATVDLAGLDDKAAKKARELLYGAAYSANRKVKVRTDKAAQTAIGVLVGDVEAPAPEPADVSTPLSSEPLSTTTPDGTVWHWIDMTWVKQTQEPAPEIRSWREGGEIELGPVTFIPEERDAGTDADEAQQPTGVPIQPKNSKREVKDRKYDLTQLRAGSHGYYVHRDYASHYFRWGWASRHCTPTTRLLDLGSGQDLALARVLIYHNGLPESMVAVDLNKLQGHVQPKWLTVYDETNVCEGDTQLALLEAHGPFNLITAFEIIEHMPVEEGDRLLGAIRNLLSEDGYALLSTPVFNGKAAANHIHEYTIEELFTKIEAAGLRVEKRYGTFGSYHDMKRGVTQWCALRFGMNDGGMAAQAVASAMIAFYDGCREFYADDVMANFMAPMLADYARNNAWKLVRA